MISCGRRGVVVKDKAFPWLLGGLCRVAVPHAAANQIGPAVAIDIHGGQADIGSIVLSDIMPHPIVRPAILKPVEPFGFGRASAGDEIEMAVAI